MVAPSDAIGVESNQPMAPRAVSPSVRLLRYYSARKEILGR
jgi:hypothetical protein